MINWAGFVPAALFVSLIPGANQLLGLSNAVRHGVAYALAGIGGRLAGFAVLIGLVVAGLGAAMTASATVLELVRWAGVAYLAWIGFTSLRRAWRARCATFEPSGTVGKTVWRVIVDEFIVAISNPKALLLFAALLPQFTGDSHSGEIGTRLALLGVAYLGIELVVGTCYVGFGHMIRTTGVSRRTTRRIDLGSGVCFLGLAGLLAADETV
jgi:threonine/homoserine/homoserine lactone efflux protein